MRVTVATAPNRAPRLALRTRIVEQNSSRRSAITEKPATHLAGFETPWKMSSACIMTTTGRRNHSCSTVRSLRPEADQTETVPATDSQAVVVSPRIGADCASSAAAKAPVVVGGALALPLLFPTISVAAEASAIPIDVFVEFLDKVEAMGPLGCAAFGLAVMFAECIPLFPTQPLSLSAGLLYGPYKGAGLCLGAYLGAATTAFLLARGVGRTLAEKVIKAETTSSKDDEEEDAESSVLANVQEAIENGTQMQQVVSIILLRLTPVVPFSASNYILGLSPLKFLPYFGATSIGMIPWAVLFASLGGAGRSLLDGGEDLQQVLGELGEKASMYTEEAIAGVVFLAVVAGGVKTFQNWQISRDPENAVVQNRQGGGKASSVSRNERMPKQKQKA